ncbi:MAG: PIN domain protein [Kiritimatiellae bacterium]|nr:PIN domain protein [Kiritimatiellia bacterium]
MRIYLDNCCYNRPFDGQEQLRVRLETEAKLRIQDLMRLGTVEYVWSKVLDYELSRSPYPDQVGKIEAWADWAAVYVEMGDEIVERGRQIMDLGVKRMDALHLASALAAHCDWFLTTDKGILKHVAQLNGMRIANPVNFVMEEQQ